jgi:predicted DNA binding protein/PAS domain-containing protein
VFETWQYHPAQILLQLAGLLACGIFWYAAVEIRKRGAQHTLVLGALLSACNIVWTFAAAMKIANVTLTAKLLFYKLELIAAAPIPSLLLLFVISFIKPDLYTRKTVAILSVVPLIITTLVWVNPSGLLLPDPVLIDVGRIATLEHGYTPLTTLYIVWNLAAPIAAAGLLMEASASALPGRKSKVILITSILLPVAVLLFKVADIYPADGVGINLTPAVGGISFAVASYSIVKNDLFELISVANTQIVERSPTGYVISDAANTIVYTNQAARDLLDATAHELEGAKLTGVLPGECDLLGPGQSNVATEQVEHSGRTIDVSSRRFSTMSGTPGTLTTLSDVSILDMNRKHERDRAKLLLSEKSFDGTAGEACRLLVEQYGFASSWVWTGVPTTADSLFNSATAMYCTDTVDPSPEAVYDTHQKIRNSPTVSTVSKEYSGRTSNTSGQQYTIRSIRIGGGGSAMGIITVLEPQSKSEMSVDVLKKFATALAKTLEESFVRDAQTADEAVRVVLEIRPDSRQIPVVDAIQNRAELHGQYAATYHEYEADTSRTTVTLSRPPSATDGRGGEPQIVGNTHERDAPRSTGSDTDFDHTERTETQRTSFRIAARSPVQVLSEHSAFIESTTADTEHVCVTATLSRRTDLSVVLDALSGWAVNLRSKETVGERPAVPHPPTFEDLSDAEFTTLKTAVQMGLFERPQGATGDEIADALGVSRSTVMRRVRAAERAVLEQIFYR